MLITYNVLFSLTYTIERLPVQDPPSIEEVLRELALAEELVNTFAVRAKRYWRGWGPSGVPMILAIDARAQSQL
jgi:hypothetical protein